MEGPSRDRGEGPGSNCRDVQTDVLEGEPSKVSDRNGDRPFIRGFGLLALLMILESSLVGLYSDVRMA